MSRIVINVSGRRFITTRETLSKYKHTTLGKLLTDNEGTEYFFDADEEVFREVLRYHRTGELHVPQNMCYQTFTKQLKFWGVEMSAIEDCCSK
ncbi:Shal [Bugula neritina]|uniref:Shal n=1 Tax=Bugula neritina TaxID=10212 RepID=A0A7J7KE04_BUGNE|nr:Shal [Bugula neritina]